MNDNIYDVVGQYNGTSQQQTLAQQATIEYSVSLVNANALIGSATLVSISSACGLLTADHVWEAICRGENKEYFSIVMLSTPHRFEYPFEGCTPFIVGKYSHDHEMEGPDLMFIRLDHPEKLSTLKAHKSFYSIEGLKGMIFESIPYTLCKWIISGSPWEKASLPKSSSGGEIGVVSQFAGVGTFLGITERNGFDFVDIKIESGCNNFPESFAGVSGGGVWIAYLLAEDENGKVLKPEPHLFLAGVVYYQFEDEPGYKILRLHGPRSIYKCVRDAVEGRS